MSGAGEGVLHPVAHTESDFQEKFGIPRQSGLASSVRSRVVFEPEYRDANALKGLEGYSHIWLIWMFSGTDRGKWSPTVRPPRLGGDARMGVFATRSPFRPNPVGLSCVRLESIERDTPQGPVIHVSGIDMLDGTPVFDIKPYQPATEAHPQARAGFTKDYAGYRLCVHCPQDLLQIVPDGVREGLLETLSLDPRPGYQHDEERIYGISYAGYNVQFRVSGQELTVIAITER